MLVVIPVQRGCLGQAYPGSLRVIGVSSLGLLALILFGIRGSWLFPISSGSHADHQAYDNI